MAIACLFLLPAVAPSARAQVQTTGTPGSPSATTTIDGRYIPNPPPPFAGKVNLSAADSKPGWPPTVESFGVGVDTRTGVEDKDYQLPFRFTGKLDELTIKLGPGQLTEADDKVMHQYVNRANDEASD